MSSRSFIGRAVLSALGIAMLTALPAAAQRAQSIEISAFGGGYFGNPIYQCTTGTLCPNIVTVNSSGLYGARLGFNVSRQFGVEFSWSGATPSLSFSNTAQSPKGTLGIHNYDLDAMFDFGRQRAWGYMGFGVGWSSFDPNVSDASGPYSASTKSYFSANAAFGMKLFVTPHVALQFDARYRWSHTDHAANPGAGCVYYCYSYSSAYYGAGELTGGLTYVAFK